MKLSRRFSEEKIMNACETQSSMYTTKHDISGACKCWEETKQKILQRLFCACLYCLCLYFSMLMYNSHILYVSSGYIKVGHYTKHKDSTTITVSMDKRKARNRKCRRPPPWGGMRCKINFPTCCQFVYYSD